MPTQAATPHHLKIAAWHDNHTWTGDKLPFRLDEVKLVLMPRQALIKKLGPLRTLSVPELRDKMAPYVIKYQNLVPQHRPAADMDIKGALQIYKYFHQLARQPTWGDVPIRCTCKVCFPNCVCGCIPIQSDDTCPCRFYCSYCLCQWPQEVQAGDVCVSSRRNGAMRRRYTPRSVSCREPRRPSSQVSLREADPVIPEPVLPLSSDNDEIQMAFSAFCTFIHTDLGICRLCHGSGSGRAANQSWLSRAKYLRLCHGTAS